MFIITSPGGADILLSALAEQLAAVDASFRLVVVGGAGLLELGVVERATRDVDVVALQGPDGCLLSAEPLPETLVAARDQVAKDFGVPTTWLNGGPTGLLQLGLPRGFSDRLIRRSFGPGLDVGFASRLDQIHLKLYALVDQGAGKHEADLRALDPSAAELLEAARWSRTHDPSEGFRDMLAQALAYLGVSDADLGP